MGCPKGFPQVLEFCKHKQCQTLPALRERRRRKLGDRPLGSSTNSGGKDSEVVPILRECGKFCEGGSPESMSSLRAHPSSATTTMHLSRGYGTMLLERHPSTNLGDDECVLVADAGPVVAMHPAHRANEKTNAPSLFGSRHGK